MNEVRQGRSEEKERERERKRKRKREREKKIIYNHKAPLRIIPLNTCSLVLIVLLPYLSSVIST